MDFFSSDLNGCIYDIKISTYYSATISKDGGDNQGTCVIFNGVINVC